MYNIRAFTGKPQAKNKTKQKNTWDARSDASATKRGRCVSPDAPCIRIIPHVKLSLGTKQGLVTYFQKVF